MITIDPVNFFGECALPVISGRSAFTPGFVTIQNGGSLTIAGELEILCDLNVFDHCSQLLFTGGTIRFSSVYGTMLISDQGTVLMNGGTIFASQPVAVEHGARFVQQGGRFSLRETASASPEPSGSVSIPATE
jgi:hypothetical protein